MISGEKKANHCVQSTPDSASLFSVRHGVCPVLVGMATGLVVGVATVFLWEAIPRGTFARRIWDGIFYPEYLAVDRMTDWLSPGNPDQGILYWLIVHPVYCVSLGGLIGLAGALSSRSRRKRKAT